MVALQAMQALHITGFGLRGVDYWADYSVLGTPFEHSAAPGSQSQPVAASRSPWQPKKRVRMPACVAGWA